jgi:hypothetical protein
MIMNMMIGMRGNAGLGIEHSLDGRKARTQRSDQTFEHMIATDTQPVPQNLYVGMTIADMPAKPREILRGLSRYLHQGFRLSGDPDDRAVIKHEPVAIPEYGRVRQIEQKCKPARSR